MTTELVDVVDAVDLWNKVDFFGLSSAELCAEIEETSRVQNRLDAAKASMLAAFESRQEHRVEGASLAGGVDDVPLSDGGS